MIILHATLYNDFTISQPCRIGFKIANTLYCNFNYLQNHLPRHVQPPSTSDEGPPVQEPSFGDRSTAHRDPEADTWT